MVRKDIKPWLFGYVDPIMFENDPKLRKAAYVVRQLVKLTKIRWIITNPAKITRDAISNTAVLFGYDVPVAKIDKYGKEAATQLTEFENLRVASLDALVHGDKKKHADIEAKIKDHPLAMMLNNGMMQSINIEIMVRDEQIISGAQQDIENLLNSFIKDEKGDNNEIGKSIVKAAKIIGMDGLVQLAADKTRGYDKLAGFSKALEKSANSLKSIKEKEDGAKILSELLMTPGSQAVKLGSYATQVIDIIPRSILLRHLLDEGATEEEAVATTLAAFIDYKQNMPKHLKVLSDYGVLLFPSYWMRIQKVIFSMAKKKPVTVISALAIEESLMMNIPTIMDSSLYHKLTGFGDIVNPPPILGFFYLD